MNFMFEAKQVRELNELEILLIEQALLDIWSIREMKDISGKVFQKYFFDYKLDEKMRKIYSQKDKIGQRIEV